MTSILNLLLIFMTTATYAAEKTNVIEVQIVIIEGDNSVKLANVHFFCERKEEAVFKGGFWTFDNKTCFSEIHPTDKKVAMIMRLNFSSMQFKCEGKESKRPTFLACAQKKNYNEPVEAVLKKYEEAVTGEGVK